MDLGKAALQNRVCLHNTWKINSPAKLKIEMLSGLMLKLGVWQVSNCVGLA